MEILYSEVFFSSRFRCAACIPYFEEVEDRGKVGLSKRVRFENRYLCNLTL